MKADKEKSTEDTLIIKTYIPTKEFSEEIKATHDNLLTGHPRDRKYLTSKEYHKDFVSDTEKAKEILAYAKTQNWEASHNKKSREITIKVSPRSKKEDTTEKEPSLKKLRFFNAQGDLNLEATPESLNEPKQSDLNSKKGFVKSNKESRAGNRNAIPLQDEAHGHSVLEVAEAYNFPIGDGDGQTIGIIELGGKFLQSDLDVFFEKYKIEQPKTQLVGKPTKTPINENTEVTADIQVAGILAPKAKLVIYYGESILEAMKTALSDARNKLTVISISWAGSEYGYSQAELNELNNVFHEASLRGITVVGASGDYGAYNNKNFPNVNVPVIFPYVLGCGGTKLEMQNDKISAEVVWNESLSGMAVGTGGGFSQKVTQPIYQQAASQSYLNRFPQFKPYHQAGGRSIPDISANAADASGYSIYFEGQWMKIGGTSLATPLWAALIARINSNLGYQLGFINSYLYQLMDSDVFHQIVQGNNNLYLGALAWNPCTGLGTPNGERLQEAIKAMK